jgi:SAM-dependent methyltransferase
MTVRWRTIGAPLRPFLGGSPDTRLVCVDIEDRPGTNLVADAQSLHVVEANSVDFVWAFNVLEHVRHPDRVIAECERILKLSGIKWIDVPFVHPIHSDPDAFYRFSQRGLAIFCERFEKLDRTLLRGPASNMGRRAGCSPGSSIPTGSSRTTRRRKHQGRMRVAQEV